MWLKEFFGPRATARYELEGLRNYIDKLEDYLEEAKEEFNNWADAEAAKLPSPQRDDFYEHLSEEYWRYSEIFPRILRNSFLVTLLSFLENELAWICKSLREKKDVPISWTRLHGDALERAKVYISKLCELGFPTGQTWKEINEYRAIRNCILHRSGNIVGDRNEKGLRHCCSKPGEISLDSDDNLVLSKEFCLQAISTLQVFLDELYDSYDQVIPAR